MARNADRKTDAPTPAGPDAGRGKAETTRNGPAAKAGGHAPGADIRVPLRSWVTSLVLWLLSVALLSAAFPPLRMTWLAHVALAPMLVAIVRAPSGRSMVLSAIAAGVIFYGGQMYWMAMITWPAYVGVVLFCLIFWALFALLMRWVAGRVRVPLVLAAPLVWVALEWLRSWLLTGFPWLFLGHPQAAEPVLLQVADLTGVYGLSALSAATAGLVADFLTWPVFLRYGKRIRVARALRVGLVAVVVLWAFVVVYGFYRLRPVEMAEGPLVVTVQPNVPQDLKPQTPESASREQDEEVPVPTEAPKSDETAPGEEPAPEETPEEYNDPSYTQAMELTREALKEHPAVQLVVWPETTVVDYLNRDYLEATFPGLDKARQYPSWKELLEKDPERLRKQLLERDLAQVRAQLRWREINELLRGHDTDLLAGALALEPGDDRLRFDLRYNSAYLFRYEGEDAWYTNLGRYDKKHIVPFGEYVPFRKSAPWLYRLLMAFTPYTYDYNLEEGEAYRVMVLRDPEAGRAWRFGVPICYEDAFSDVCRQMVYGEGLKRADFLVNISNDGWFHGTVELEQHWDQSVFRAVENRVPVVRSVNTGISGFIDSSGRTVSRVHDEAGRVRSIPGLDAWRLEVDPRTSFYGRYGDVFAWVVSLAAAAMLILAASRPWRAATAKPSEKKEAEK